MQKKKKKYITSTLNVANACVSSILFFSVAPAPKFNPWKKKDSSDVKEHFITQINEKYLQYTALKSAWMQKRFLSSYYCTHLNTVQMKWNLENLKYIAVI